jgi:hypothetical protein
VNIRENQAPQPSLKDGAWLNVEFILKRHGFDYSIHIESKGASDRHIRGGRSNTKGCAYSFVI